MTFYPLKTFTSAAVLLAASPVLAQTTPFFESVPQQNFVQQNTVAPAADIQAIIAELRALIQSAKDQNAAHPLFLKDLEALAERYARTPREAPAAPDYIPFEETPIGQQFQDPLESSEYQFNEAQPVPQTAQNALPPTPTFPTQPNLQPEITNIPLPETSLQPITPAAPPTENNAVGSALLLYDNFTDGEFATNPTWIVRQGEWQIDPRYGLRALNKQAQLLELTSEDLITALLDGGLRSLQTRSRDSAALIESQQAISNAFYLSMRLADHAGEGATHLILHQGGERWLGYRLEIRGGLNPKIVLTRRGARGYVELGTAPATALAANPEALSRGEPVPHVLDWIRYRNGDIVVQIDGVELIRATDRVFRDNWAGVAMFNAGSDVSVREIAIRSAN